VDKPSVKPMKGFKWEKRDWCSCSSKEQCPWFGNCLGKTWPHWAPVKDE